MDHSKHDNSGPDSSGEFVQGIYKSGDETNNQTDEALVVGEAKARQVAVNRDCAEQIGWAMEV